MRRALALVLLPLLATGVAAAAGGALQFSRSTGSGAHVPERLRDAARGAPIGWVTLVRSPGPTTSGATTTPGTTTSTTPTTTEPGPNTPPPTEPEPLPRRTGVQLDDTPGFSLVPTRNPVGAGSVELVATNSGEDDHDLTVRDSTQILGSTGIVPSQEAAAITLDLTVGDYTLFCSLPGHEAGGMRATLQVR